MAATLKTIRAITQALDGRQATWDNVSLPVPDRVWIIATDTSAVKIGNGATKYADLPVAFYMNDVNAIAAQLPYKADQEAVNSLTDRVDAQASLVDERLIVGATDPQHDTGVIGAHYLNATTKTLFGPKTVNGWGVGTPLIGGASSGSDIGTFTDFETGFTQFASPP